MVVKMVDSTSAGCGCPTPCSAQVLSLSEDGHTARATEYASTALRYMVMLRKAQMASVAKRGHVAARELAQEFISLASRGGTSGAD